MCLGLIPLSMPPLLLRSDRYCPLRIPHRSFSLIPTSYHGSHLVLLPLHIAPIISISTIGMRLLKISNCFVILVINVRESCNARSNYAETTRRSVASQLNGSPDFWRICNSVLNRGKSTIPLFNGPEVLPISTDKANLFARNFSCNFFLDDDSQQIPDFPSRTEQRFSSKNITAKMSFSCNL